MNPRLTWPTYILHVITTTMTWTEVDSTTIPGRDSKKFRCRQISQIHRRTFHIPQGPSGGGFSSGIVSMSAERNLAHGGSK